IAAVSHPCSSVYRGFAECLVTLGDSVSSKTDNPQDINSICKSWDAFQVCVSGVLLGCRGDAAEMWESLRAESRKTVFAGNLYDMCASPAPDMLLSSPAALDVAYPFNIAGLMPVTLLQAHICIHSLSWYILILCVI
uniref:Neuritin 1-like b n=1 Tax=Sinocyclocheilus rhinocerous TaxID=307959 RepID=A0A673J1N2_9TELE